jgi:hypothetical protein
MTVINSPRSLLLFGFGLTGLSLITFSYSWIVLFSIIPILMYLMKSKGLSRQHITLDFYLGGVILCGFANIFLFQMSPENWGIGLNGWITVVARTIAWVLVCSFSALAYGALGYCLSSIKMADRRIFVLPLLFPVAEVLRSYLFAAMAYGPNGSLSPNFNWGSLAVPASGTILVYSSRIIGFFGLTFIVVLKNISFPNDFMCYCISYYSWMENGR